MGDYAGHSRCLREQEALCPPLPVSGVWTSHVAMATSSNTLKPVQVGISQYKELLIRKPECN